MYYAFIISQFFQKVNPFNTKSYHFDIYLLYNVLRMELSFSGFWYEIEGTAKAERFDTTTACGTCRSYEVSYFFLRAKGACTFS